MTLAADSNDISSLPQADQDAIGATLISLMTGFQERDAEKLVGIYTSDADWVNAFGTVKKGGDEIVGLSPWSVRRRQLQCRDAQSSSGDRSPSTHARRDPRVCPSAG